MASLRAKFEEHFSCAICLEQFEDPKVLPCLHSYCYKCIVKLERTRGYIRCPECRMKVKVGDPPDISFLPSNFFANNLIATLSLTSTSDGGKIVCENCDSGDCGETRCEQCNRYLCQFCIDAHRRMRDTKHHTLKSLDELKESRTPIIVETIRCRKHQDEIIKLYCTTCQSTICRDCTIVDHRDHDFSFVSDVAQEKKRELKELVGEVKERKKVVGAAIENVSELERNLNTRSESTIEEVNKYFEKLAKDLDTEKKRFVEEVNTLKNAKLKQLHVQREGLEVTLASCESNISFTEQAFQNGDDVQILNMKKYISESLKSLKNKDSVIKPCVDDHIEFVASLTGRDIVDRTALHCSVVDRNTETKYNTSFNDDVKWLTVGIEGKITIYCGFLRFKPAHVNVKPSFTGVKVKAVTLSDIDETGDVQPDNHMLISFVPLEVGLLKYDVFINGRRSPSCPLTKMVRWGWVKESEGGSRFGFVGSGVFESGIHTWKITLDHEICNWDQRADFTIGVIYRDEDDDTTTRGITGFVKSKCSVSFNLDMSSKKLKVTPSWGRRPSSEYDITSSKVSPYFEVDCDECFPKIKEMGPFSF